MGRTFYTHSGNSITGNFFCTNSQLVSDVTVQHGGRASRCRLRNPSLFCNAIWENLLTHLTNTCHMLTLRITATRLGNPADGLTAAASSHVFMFILTQCASYVPAAQCGTFDRYSKIRFHDDKKEKKKKKKRKYSMKVKG